MKNYPGLAVAALLALGAIALPASAQLYTNGMPTLSDPLPDTLRIPADTYYTQGRSPQTVGIGIEQLQGIRAAQLTGSGTQAISGTTGYLYAWTIGTPTTVNGVGAPTGLQTSSILRFVITQGAGGSHTVAWDPVYKWSGGTAPVITATAGRTDIVTCVFSNLLLCSVTQNYF